MRKKLMGELLCDIKQSPELIPNFIPKGTSVEIIRKVEHHDFYSGKGYVIYWEEKAYADVVDVSRIKIA